MKKITKAKRLRGEILTPGDKSVSIRALLMGALARGTTSITGLGTGEDVQSAALCLKGLGILFNWKSPADVDVTGKGLFNFTPPQQELDARNSGTSFRLLSGILAGQNFTSIITGDESLCSRPMRRIVEPLRKMGSQITGPQDGGFPPLTIHGNPLKGITYVSPVASAQVKSSILLAGLHAEGKTMVTEPAISRDHTERMLRYFGVPVTQEGTSVTITGKHNFDAQPIHVPGDISSAAFFIIAALLVPDSKVTIRNIGINESRTGIIDVVNQMGGNIELTNQRFLNEEPVADLTITTAELHGVTLEGEIIPRIIDEMPILSVAATQAKGETIIRNAEELRVKESDRIKSIVENLRAMGAEVYEKNDGMIIPGPQKLTGADINGYNDHRIIMAFTIAGLIAEGTTVIDNEEWADISFPGFFNLLEKLQE